MRAFGGTPVKVAKHVERLIWAPFIFLALATFRTPFTADEVFVYAEISRGFRHDPSTIWGQAWRAFQAGQVEGRIVSPIFHFLSNAGVASTEYFAEVFSTDLYFANGMARVALLLISTLLFASISRNFGSEFSRDRLFRLSIILFPGTLVLNRRYAAGRISVWSYLLALVFVLGLILLVQLLFKRASKQSPASFKSFLFSGSVAGVLGLLLGTTYEATRIAVPSALLVACLAAAPAIRAPRGNRRFQIIYTLLIFSGTSVLSSIYVQLRNFSVCADGCYQPAQVRAEFFNFGAFFARVLGQLPWFSIPEGLISATSVWSTTWAPLLGLSLLIITFKTIYPLLVEKKNDTLGCAGKVQGPAAQPLPDSTPTRGPLLVAYRAQKMLRSLVTDPSLGLMTVGVVWCSSIGVGMASSRTIADLSSPWDRLGVGSRDALLMHTGWAFIYVGGISWLVAKASSWNAMRLLSLIVAITVSLTISLSQIANVTTTHRELGGPDVKHQEVLFAAGLNSFGEEFNDLRCSIFKIKIQHFKEWLGHDQMIYYGLNNRFEQKYNYPFCAITPEEIFADYDG